MIYITNLKNKLTRLSDDMKSLSGSADHIQDAYATYLDQKMNSTMKVFTVLTSIFFPLTIIPLALVSVSSCIVFDCGFWDKFLIILIPIIYSVFNSLFDLRMAFYKPDFNWTNEIYPIKQSLSVFVSLFGGWIYVAAFIGLYSFAYQFISQLLYSALFMALTLVLILILTLWLEKVAVKRFEEL